jgi:hypothetical protein
MLGDEGLHCFKVGSELDRLSVHGRRIGPSRIASGKANGLGDVQLANRPPAVGRRAAKSAAIVVTLRAPCRQPPLRIGADRAPNKA